MALCDAPSKTPHDAQRLTDAELGAELCPDNPSEGLFLVEGMTVEKRVSYEALVCAARDVQLWEAGLGPLPPGIIICKERTRYGRRKGGA